jgi:hypothetical protein
LQFVTTDRGFQLLLVMWNSIVHCHTALTCCCVGVFERLIELLLIIKN